MVYNNDQECGCGCGWGCNKDCQEECEDEFVDKFVYINCVVKIVKGGCNFQFVVLVVVGDQKGCVGFGQGKVCEVLEVICKVMDEVKKNMICVLLCEGCMLYYDGCGCYGVGKVVLCVVFLGIGVIVGGLMCVVLEIFGVGDVVVKFLGMFNLYNMICVIFDVLKCQNLLCFVVVKCGLKVGDLVNCCSDGVFLLEVIEL